MLTVLIFDSGVGGLSISHALTEYLPSVQQILLSDNAFFPYGEKSEDILIPRVTELLVKAADVLEPDCIIVACNTASTVALDSLRKTLSIPVIGVVPAIKPAAELSVTKVIGLLATPATVERSYTRDLIENFAADCDVISVGSTRLVELAEQHLRGSEVSLDEIEEILLPFRSQNIGAYVISNKKLDVLVLGCTHFPLLDEQLREILPDSIVLIDSSMAIARQVGNILDIEEDIDIEGIRASKMMKIDNNYRCLLTQHSEDAELVEGIRQFGFGKPELF